VVPAVTPTRTPPAPPRPPNQGGDAGGDAGGLADGRAGGLGRLVRKGLTWSFVNTVVGRAGAMLIGIILARLLSPADYGVFAVALVALNALLSINELGVSLAIVRWKGDLDRIGPTVTSLSIAGSVLLYAACYALAPWAATSMGSPEAAGVLRLLCAGVLIDGVTAVPAALLTRTFRQDQRLLADSVSFVTSTVVSLWLAAAGFGAWSLAWGRLVGNLSTAVALLIMAPRRWRPGFDRGEARRLLAFGLPLAGSSLLVFAMLNLDYIVVGSILGQVALGLYLLAFNLSSWPVKVFSMAVRRVSLAGFSRLQDSAERMEDAFCRALALLAAVTVPVCVLLGLLATQVVRLLYGERWVPAAAALAFLAVLGAVRVATELGYDFLVAAGRSRATLWLQALWTLALVPALALGARVDGIRGVAAAHAVIGIGLILPAFGYALWRAGVRPGPVAASLARPFAGGLLAAGAALAARWLLDGTLPVLVAAGVAGMALHALAVAPMRRLLRAGPPAAAPAPATEAA
jgi:PST family polysaccharide transporter